MRLAALFVWVVVEAGKRVKRGTAGFLWLSAVCQAAAGGIILLTSAIWWVYGAAGGACVALTAERVPLMGDEVVG